MKRLTLFCLAITFTACTKKTTTPPTNGGVVVVTNYYNYNLNRVKSNDTVVLTVGNRVYKAFSGERLDLADNEQLHIYCSSSDSTLIFSIWNAENKLPAETIRKFYPHKRNSRFLIDTNYVGVK